MDLHVESRPGYRGQPEPTAFELGGQVVKVRQIIDRWIASDHSYFKIEADDSGIYILRFTPDERHWEMTLFQSPAGLEFSGIYSSSRRARTRQ
ncbi:hypothetical protein EDC30_10211 [Paucimonas lemoignei]|uniref:Uncharacterized protein n=1 Tax=Paucimonas lemoignei TaxID=29443 RepID=A0A4R3HY78_PAULE|nr:hypothetical protein [Paucimonas lemoignei]TCS38276.1 hypothetical protein EDC30_10211 [Paucimonas lemoignei]